MLTGRRPRGFTWVELVMVVVIVGLLAAIVLPQFGAIHDEGSEVFVRETLEGIATAAERYAVKNNNQYPSSMNALLLAVPPYISQNPCGTVTGGYSFTCTMSVAGYSITAMSVQHPTEIWSVTTGLALTKP